MKNLQYLKVGDKIKYAGKVFCIKDWKCLPEKQFAFDGTAIYSLPILDDGRILDWLFWDEVEVTIQIKGEL